MGKLKNWIITYTKKIKIGPKFIEITVKFLFLTSQTVYTA